MDEEEAQKYIDKLSELTCYKFKIELIKICGVKEEHAKVMAIYTSSFPLYSKYFGGDYVSS